MEIKNMNKEKIDCIAKEYILQGIAKDVVVHGVSEVNLVKLFSEESKIIVDIEWLCETRQMTTTPIKIEKWMTDADIKSISKEHLVVLKDTFIENIYEVFFEKKK